MKKCPTCGKEFEDSMKFCQVDGAELVTDEPAFDPYATVVGHKIDLTPGPTETPAEEPQIHETTGSIPITPPDEVLELPGSDPLKTMYVSESELKDVLGGQDEDILESEPPEQPTPLTPPPSPFADADAETVLSPLAGSSSYQTPEPKPMEEWSPPPVPDAAWKDQQIGSNTPFQPPPAGTGGQNQNKTLALISMIAGIAGLTVCCGSFIISGVALILGFMARSKAKQNAAEYGGEGMAMAGIITGIVGVLAGVVIWILYGSLILGGGMR